MSGGLGRIAQLQGKVNTANQLLVASSFQDTAVNDAFSRIRTSDPSFVFDAQFTYDLQPLLLEAITAESGAAVTHDATNRQALMTFASTPTGGAAYLQSFEHFRYQPGRSHQIFITGNFLSHVADVTKFLGYSDGTDGIELQSNGTGFQWLLRSSSDVGDQAAVQADWNIDPMDGTGPSGETLDVTKGQIVVIDFQALYWGRVRCGLDIGGQVYWCHQFLNANTQTAPYIATANLPIRAGMTCTGTVSTTMNYTCASVISEGGQEHHGGYRFVAAGAATAANGAQTHILSVQPKAEFNGFANRTKFSLDSVTVLVTGNSPVKWQLCLGDVLTGTTTFSDVNATYSAVEMNTAGTTSGAPAIVFDEGYVGASNQTKGAVAQDQFLRYPITLDAAGAARANARVTVLVTGLGGASACQVSLEWTEIR